MNKYNSEYKEIVSNLEKYILSKTYGTTLTFEELNEFIGEDLKDEYGKIRFKSIIRRVKTFLYKKGYVLRNINGIGYYILKPNQIAGYTYRTFIVRPLNSFYKAQLILECTEKSKLNEEEKQKHIKAENLNSAMLNACNILIEDSNYYCLKEN